MATELKEIVIDWPKVENMTPEEIENLRVSVVKEIQAIKENKFIIQEEINELKKQMIVLEQKKHDLKIKTDKASHLIRQKEADVDILTSKFWQKRKGF